MDLIPAGIGVLVGMIIASAITMHTNVDVTDKEIEKAQAVCLSNGGIRYIQKDNARATKTAVLCHNGALFMLE